MDPLLSLVLVNQVMEDLEFRVHMLESYYLTEICKRHVHDMETWGERTK